MYNSKTPLERTMDAVLGHELRKLNSHLPKQRRTLTELLRSKDTTIQAVDGSSIILKKEDLPPPLIERRSRSYLHRRCPSCGGKAYRYGTVVRVLHDLGDVRSGRPVDIHLTYSTHQCSSCWRCFNADMDDLALPKCLYTLRVQHRAVRLVIEDSLPYRAASWHLWRDHRVFVPFATIQNWVEAAGEKR